MQAARNFSLVKADDAFTTDDAFIPMQISSIATLLKAGNP